MAFLKRNCKFLKLITDQRFSDNVTFHNESQYPISTVIVLIIVRHEQPAGGELCCNCRKVTIEFLGGEQTESDQGMTMPDRNVKGEAAAAAVWEHQEGGSDPAAQHAQQQGQLHDS